MTFEYSTLNNCVLKRIEIITVKKIQKEKTKFNKRIGKYTISRESSKKTPKKIISLVNGPLTLLRLKKKSPKDIN